MAWQETYQASIAAGYSEEQARRWANDDTETAKLARLYRLYRAEGMSESDAARLTDYEMALMGKAKRAERRIQAEKHDRRVKVA